MTDQSYYLNIIYKNKLDDIYLIIINFLITIIYNMTNVHLLIETPFFIIKIILKILDIQLLRRFNYLQKIYLFASKKFSALEKIVKEYYDNFYSFFQDLFDKFYLYLESRKVNKKSRVSKAVILVRDILNTKS
jgi:hypothetical protein